MDRDEAIKLLTGGPDGVREWNQRRERNERMPKLLIVPNGTERQPTLRKRSVTVGINAE
jgi:hypothetical protein